MRTSPTRLKGQPSKPTLHPEATEDDSESNKEVVIEDERIIIEGGGVTPITPVDDRLLDQDDQEDPIRAKTPSGVVTESLFQMNMDFPASTPAVSDPPDGDQED